MTLGTFSTATYRLNKAWETIHFHPDASFMKKFAKNTVESIHSIENLHRGLDAAFASFKRQCQTTTVFKRLPWNGDVHEVKMKFAVAFVIGDTEQHDKFCCRFQSRSMGTICVCRHCNCPTKDLVNPSAQQQTQLWTPKSYEVPECYPGGKQKEYWKNLSHHNVKNAFHSLDFGANIHNTHFASPGESLHMMQLGNAKRAVESFARSVSSMPPTEKGNNPPKKGNQKEAFTQFSTLALNYGHSLSHQSDRHFPRLRFTSEILNSCKKNGKDHPGMILCTVVALLSKKGKSILKDLALMDCKKMNQFVKGFEFILFVDTFLQRCELKVENVPKVNRLMEKFMRVYTQTFKRGGNGSCLIKNHLFFHLQKCIEMFGPPAGWDSAHCEGHHKKDMKSPSINTQRNAHTVIGQTCSCKMEMMTLKRAMTLVGCPIISSTPTVKTTAGSKCHLQFDNNGMPTMTWVTKCNANKPLLPQQVTDCCCRTFIPNSN